MRPRVSEALIAEFRYMYDGRGLSTVQIAREKHISHEWVRRLLQRSPGWSPRYLRNPRRQPKQPEAQG